MSFDSASADPVRSPPVDLSRFDPAATGRTDAATLRTAGEVPRIGATRFTAPGSVTRGRFGLFEVGLDPHAGGAAPHFHQTFSESFYVVSGTLTVFDGRAWVPAGAGDFLHVAERGIHGFRNDSDEPTRFLILFAPGVAREQYFQDMAALRGAGTPTREQIDELCARHDQINLPDLR